MAEKDIVSKDVLQLLAADIANILLHLDVDKSSVELLQTEQQRIESRRADMVARMRKRESGEVFILHVEIQNANDPTMPVRMWRYASDILMAYPNEPIYQYLVYIGKHKLSMSNTIVLPDFTYQYRTLDMHTVDCGVLIAQDTPEALILAILCDFKQCPTQDVVNYIVTRLKQLSGEDEQRFRNYYEMLETLADNRNLHAQLLEAKTMLTQVDYKRFSTYQWGLEDGINEGIAKARTELESLLTAKEALLKVKEEALALEQARVQQEQARTHKAVKQLITLNALSYTAIAEMFNMTEAEVEMIAKDTAPTQH